jgi:hypothetical protein
VTAFGFEAIGEPIRERRLGSHYCQIDAFGVDEPNYCIGVQYIDGNGCQAARDARIAGRADDMGDTGFLRELPREGVLAGARAEDEDPHDAKPLNLNGLFAAFGLQGM